MPYAGIDLPDHFISPKGIGSPGVFESVEYLFYDALARAAQYGSASSEQRSQYREALAADHQHLEAWAENCPENFVNRAALVGAEIARIEGRELDAQRLYERAIRSARENGFAQNEGIANELAAKFYLACGYETSGYAYLRNARAISAGARSVRCGSSTNATRTSTKNERLRRPPLRSARPLSSWT
jgi:tetratricopeptide (TPR) repeat protein